MDMNGTFSDNQDIEKLGGDGIFMDSNIKKNTPSKPSSANDVNNDAVNGNGTAGFTSYSDHDDSLVGVTDPTSTTNTAISITTQRRRPKLETMELTVEDEETMHHQQDEFYEQQNAVAKRKKIMQCCFGILAIVVIVLFAGAVRRARYDPTVQQINDLKAMIGAEPDLSSSESLQNLNKRFSPQSFAVAWLVQDDPSDLFKQYESELQQQVQQSATTKLTSLKHQLLERYVLCVLYFGSLYQSQNLLKSTYSFMSDKHVCEWNDRQNTNLGTEIGVVCNEQQQVTSIRLGDKYERGPVPIELLYFRERLQTLDLRGTERNVPEVDFELPNWVGRMTNLQILSLQSLQLTGTLPTDYGALTKLEELRLFNNKLRGTIPTEYGQMSDLWEMRLFANNLIGNIPSEIGLLNALKFLDISRNKLEGSVPVQLGNIESLQFFGVESNRLGGSIPLEVTTNWPTNAVMSLQENNFEGTLNPICDKGIEIRNADCKGQDKLSCSCCMVCL